MHTHSADGVIHVEAPESKLLTVGDFLDIWNYTSEGIPQFPSIPNNQGNQSSSPIVYVNGQKSHSEDYRDAKIYPASEIVLVFGSLPKASAIPTSYAFGQSSLKLGSPTDASNILQKIIAAPTPGSAPIGDEKAPITIVEFGDYQCNSCTIYYRNTNDEVMSKLVSTGKVKLLFKDFTLNDNVLQPYKGSTLAAEAAYCAGEQGKFWQYHDKLFENQKPEGTVWISEQALKGFANMAGVADIEKFTTCLESHKYKGVVESNNNLVNELRLNATPTFIVIPSSTDKAPVRLVGAYPYSSFEAVVNQMLSN